MATIERSPERENVNREFIKVFNPVTQELIGEIPASNREEVEDAVVHARFAQKAWGALTVKERCRFVQRWLDLLWQHHSEGIEILRRENGKADSSAFLEFLAVDNIVQYQIHNAERILKPKRRKAIFPVMQHAKLYHKPIGVVGVITPWNYPLALPFFDLVAALIAGNTVVLKPSEVTPFVAQWSADLFYEVGLPRDVLQIVQGDGRTGAALVDFVDYIQFTGSTPVGRSIGKRAVERLIPFSLELGGKDAAIVCADVDPMQAAIGLIQGAFENNGQMCISIERAYIEAPVYDKVVEALLKAAPTITVKGGAGFEIAMGSMTKGHELERTKAHIADALAKGAKIIYGGNPLPELGPLFFEPTILTDVDHSMDIMMEETFGPVLPLMKVETVDEAIRLANDSKYGLSGSVFTKDLKNAEKIALQMNTGDVSVNRAQYVSGTPGLPMGGQRESGLGRRNGPEGLLKYTASQSILLDNLLIFEENPVIATKLAVNSLKAVHWLRRYIPFI
jgi:succinate-semialdehyde dehydrogenase/glutarate-semialdehyde dehydrogenase